MSDLKALQKTLLAIDGRGYKAYQDIKGEYRVAPGISLEIMSVQADPFAAPSRLRAIVEQSVAGFETGHFASPGQRVAAADYLTREFAAALDQIGMKRRGSGQSGLINVDRPGQQVLERTSVLMNQDRVEARFTVGLPAAGRRVLGWQAAELLCSDIPQIIRRSLLLPSISPSALQKHIALYEDQEYLRSRLPELGLVAFVAHGSCLPRASGISDLPLPGAIPFQVPEQLAVSLDLPHRGPVRGMGIPKGVTLIVGGGYHGKSTLLRALERGIYNHIAGDGRELVITTPGAVKIRAEDGRRVAGVDISLFINNLPQGQDTKAFNSESASGSTSQAAAIMEALEMGADCLLLDEDTSATNFMIRDARMQELVAKNKEPIIPFIDRVRGLYQELGVSTVMVVGGSGDYFAVADTVIMMDCYQPYDVTARARAIAAKHGNDRQNEGGGPMTTGRRRCPLPSSIDPQRGRGKKKIRARSSDAIQFGHSDIDLSAVEQIVDRSQTRAIGAVIDYCRQRYIDGCTDLRTVLQKVESDIKQGGLDVISPFGRQPVGDHARPRLQEVAAAINRLRTLRIRQDCGREEPDGGHGDFGCDPG
ncbi:MAG: ABC-ATPase domain-containing protein [Bacillota bacterium]